MKQHFQDKILTLLKLTDKEKALVFDKLYRREIKKHDKLLSIGEVCDKIWLITKGIIRHSQYDDEEIEKTSCFTLENKLVTAFSSFINQTPSQENLIAIEDTEVIEIKREDFRFLVKSIPSFSEMYITILEDALLQMENVSYAIQRLSAKERYEKLILNESPELLKKVPLVHIASYLGVSPETISRVRSKI